MSILLAAVFTDKDYRLVSKYRKTFTEGELKQHLNSFYRKKIDIFDLVSKFSYCENYEEFIYDFSHNNPFNTSVSLFRVYVLPETLAKRAITKEQHIMSVEFCLLCMKGDLYFIVKRFLRYFFFLFRTMFLVFSVVIIVSIFKKLII